MTNDYFVLDDHKRTLRVPLIDGTEHTFIINLNMLTGDYLRMIAHLESITESENDGDRFVHLSHAVFFILRSCQKSINPEWIQRNITINSQSEIILQVNDQLTDLLQGDAFAIPTLTVRKKQNKEDKENAKKQEDIKRNHELLKGKIKNNLLDDVALLMTKTNNSYQDIMHMPILVFKDIATIISINELKQDIDWHLAYTEYLKQKLKVELNNADSTRQNEAVHVSVKTLKSFFG